MHLEEGRGLMVVYNVYACVEYYNMDQNDGLSLLMGNLIVKKNKSDTS